MKYKTKIKYTIKELQNTGLLLKPKDNLTGDDIFTSWYDSMEDALNDVIKKGPTYAEYVILPITVTLPNYDIPE